MLAEMARLSSQQRPLYCYLLMIVWIFLLVAGMYKYIITVETLNMPKPSLLRTDMHPNNFRRDNKLKKIINKFCNAPENIKISSEGLPTNSSWALQGVVVIIRHGDRGPLTHVRNIENVNCDVSKPDSLLQRYQEYINNATAAGRAPWAQSPGPFHNFPLLPSAPTTTCRLGQLTLLGVQQLLMTGVLLGKAYSTKFGWNIQFNTSNSLPVHNKSSQISNDDKSTIIEMKQDIQNIQISNVNKDTKVTKNEIKNVKNGITKNSISIDMKPQGKPNDGDIIVHSTRYRRALQSALALIWAMLNGHPAVANAVAHESPSLAFCSTDCACPAADNYAKILTRELKDRLETHPAIGELVTQLSKVISQSPSQISNDPHILEDALLTYLCHSAPLPCVEKPIEPPKPKKTENAQQKTIGISKTNEKVRNLLKSQNNPTRRLLFNLSPSEIRKNGYEFVKEKRDTKAMDVRPKAPLDFDSQMEKEKLGYYQQKMLENADSNYQDVILVKRNMDGDFNFNGDGPNVLEGQDLDDSDDYEEKDEEERKNSKSANTETICVRKDQVTGLFAYTDWEMKQSVKSKNLKRVSLLRAYGMIRHIVQYILQMISENKPKFVLFSGHDKTLQYLSLALGLSSDNFIRIQYASRIVLEVYKNVVKEHSLNNKNANSNNRNRSPRMIAPVDFYFRLVMNGVDVTNQLSFCRGRNHIVINGNGDIDKNKYYLCKIENIIRFIHEDYFAVFNATNFKDACSVH